MREQVAHTSGDPTGTGGEWKDGSENKAREILVIGHVSQLPDGGVVLGVNTRDRKLRASWKAQSISELERLFSGKTIRILGEAYNIPAKILDVKITASLADFRNILLRIEANELTLQIQEMDEVEIELE